MQKRIAVAAPSFARAGDAVRVFFVDDKPIGSRFAAAFRSSKLRAGHSPFVFNETARAWSVAAEHVDTQIVLDVEQEIEVAPGEPGMP